MNPNHHRHPPATPDDDVLLRRQSGVPRSLGEETGTEEDIKDNSVSIATSQSSLEQHPEKEKCDGKTVCFELMYEIVDRLRSGSYGTVYTCRRRRCRRLIRSRIPPAEESFVTNRPKRNHDNSTYSIMDVDETEDEQLPDGGNVDHEPCGEVSNDDATMSEEGDEEELLAVKVLDRNKLWQKQRRGGGGGGGGGGEGGPHHTYGAVNAAAIGADANSNSFYNRIHREVAILKELRQVPHVIQFMDFVEEPQCLYVVLELAEGGDLFDRLGQRNAYTERDARNVARILLGTIHALHQRNIVHRDLKPENLLLKSQSDDSSILLADFGFARHVDPNHKVWCTTLCGTPAFVAPEVVLGIPYGTSCDLWSTGCLLYMLLGGYPPFTAPNHRALFRKIRAGDYIFHNQYFSSVSAPAKRLMAHLMTVSVHHRWTASQALEQGDWLTESDAMLQSHDLSLTSLPNLQQFKAKRKWRSATDALRWAASAPFWMSDRITFHQQMLQWDQQDALKLQLKLQRVVSQQHQPTDRVHHSAPALGTVAQSLFDKLPQIKFANVYTLHRKLRVGSHAVVWECRHQTTGEHFAVKIVSRANLHPHDDEAVLNEVAILQALSNNPYVIQLLDFYEEDDAFYLVMELMGGGDVFDRIVKLTHYTEQDARDLIQYLLKAVGSLQQLGIAHRDLKPQNLLLKSFEDNATIRIADFGFARRVHTPQSLTSRVGTPTYVAPEILKNIPHDERVDLWSIGIITHVLLVGYPPFLDDDQKELFRRIRCGEWRFYQDDWKHVSSDAQSFIKALLRVDPNDRWSVEQALRSSWINESAARLSANDLTHSLRVLQEKRKTLRFFARAILWTEGTRSGEVLAQVQDTATAVLQKVLPQSVSSDSSNGTPTSSLL